MCSAKQGPAAKIKAEEDGTCAADKAHVLAARFSHVAVKDLAPIAGWPCDVQVFFWQKYLGCLGHLTWQTLD